MGAAGLIGLLSLAAPAAAAPALAAPHAAAATSFTLLSKDTLPSSWLTHPDGAPAPDTAWHVGISIAGKDPAGLARLAQQQHDTRSSSYRAFLTPAEYDARFGADPADTAAVTHWLAAGGLDVRYTSTDGTVLEAYGTVAQVEKTFHTTLATFSGTPGTMLAHFTANTSAPTVPTSVTSVAGLDTLSVAHTHIVHTAAHADFPIASSTNPSDLWSAYEQPSEDTGQGQQLAAFGWGAPGTIKSDLLQFQTNNHLPLVPLNVVQIGTPGTDTSGADEWDLDSQAATGMAPSAQKMTFYFANAGNSDLLGASVKTWAEDPQGAAQASGSYGLCDVLGNLGTFDIHEAALTEAAVEGRSFFASTGDNGGGCTVDGAGVNGATIGPIPSPEFPSSSPHAIGVGGTTLYLTGSPAKRDQEIAWTHTGGGTSTIYATPDWQTSSSSTTVQTYSALGRSTADVSAQSGDLLSGYNIIVGGTAESVGGTSLSAPLWQGMWARVSAAAPTKADGTRPGLGFAAPIIYALNENATAYANAFFDVTTGANGTEAAGPGYDQPTGWGVPRVSNLVRALDGTTTPAVSDLPPAAGTGGTAIPVLPACPSYPQITDPSGDATQVVAADTSQPAANQKDLDIIKAGTTWDAATSTLKFTVVMNDLSATPGSSENIRDYFTYDGVEYQIEATRSAAGAATFSWSYSSGLTSTTSLGALTGTFDNASNTVTVLLPAATYNALQATGSAAHPAIGPGSSISAMHLLSQRDLQAVTATADDASLAAACTYTVAADAPAAVVPELPYAAIAPLAGMLLLGTFYAVRRRRLV